MENAVFGYVKPKTEELKVKEHLLYKSVYCGLCRAQRRETGLFSAFTLSYDFVFLYLLRAELTGEKTEFSKKRPCRKNDGTRTVLPNPTLAYCAAASALLTYYKLLDDKQDEKAGAKLRACLLLPFARRWLKKAKKKYGLPEKELSELLDELHELEKRKDVPAEEPAECSGRMLALIASYGIEDELVAMAAEKIGLYVGKWIYLADAADDLEKDRKDGAFNPFLPDGYDGERLLAALDKECALADEMLDRVPVYDPGYRAVLKNIFFRE